MSKPRTLVALLLLLAIAATTTAIGGWEQMHLFFGRTTVETTKPSCEDEGLRANKHRRSKVLTPLSSNPDEAVENTNASKNKGVKVEVADAKANKGLTSTPAFTRRGGTQFRTVLDEVRRFPLAVFTLGVTQSLTKWCHSLLTMFAQNDLRTITCVGNCPFV